MDNNDVLRKLRFIFDLEDEQTMALFSEGGYPATRAEISDWLKADEDEDFKTLDDEKLATFLNGLIIQKRGRQDGKEYKPETEMNNNLILRKLKIALNLKDTEMVQIFELADLEVGKHEINAFFRKPSQRQYRECLDQFLRNFLVGLQVKIKGA